MKLHIYNLSILGVIWIIHLRREASEIGIMVTSPHVLIICPYTVGLNIIYLIQYIPYTVDWHILHML